MLKQGMTEVLIFLKCQNKIRVGSYIIIIIIIIIIISLFNVDAKNKVKNYNKKEIIVYIIN